MLDFSDKPYRYFPPRRNPLVAWFMGIYNRRYSLPRQHQIESLEICGQTDELKRLGRGARLMFVPNHPTHSDAQIYTEALRRIGVTSHFMAAYDVFLRSRRSAWILQRMGSFSVDREGSDSRSMKQCGDTLRRGDHALTIFPEGNVYLQNDVVTPFHDGAALIGLRCCRSLGDENIAVLAVPVSIKVTHLHDVRDQLSRRLHDLAEALRLELPRGLPPLEAVRSVGQTALARNLRQRGIDVPETESVAALIEESAESVISGLEKKMSLKPRPRDSLIDRIRRARRAVHEIRIDDSRAQDHAAAGHWADEAMLALRIASYSGAYVAARPTIDRFAETIEKLYEDIYRRVCEPWAARRALVHFSQPIDLRDFLGSFKRKARVAVRELTDACERSVQNGLDELNAQNPHSGGQLWDSADDNLSA